MQALRKTSYAGIGAAVLVTVTTLFLSGCPRFFKDNSKIPVNTLKIASMEASLRKGTAIAPGEKLHLVVTLTSSDGKTWRTEGQEGKQIAWSDLAITSSVVDVSKSGVVSLSRDPTVSDGKVGHIRVTVPGQPDVKADLDLPTRYDTRYSLSYSGMNGMDGTNGSSGSSGLTGSTGSFDPQHPSAGGNGGDGGDGTSGSDGGRGGDASDVRIWLTLHPGGGPTLIEAKVRPANGQDKLFLIDPAGGSLAVSADGGSGGRGGKGGKGGSGGSGGSGMPGGTSGRDGLDGRDGQDGFRGSGGQITVFYDPAVQPWLKLLHLSSMQGPTPKYIAMDLDPFW